MQDTEYVDVDLTEFDPSNFRKGKFMVIMNENENQGIIKHIIEKCKHRYGSVVTSSDKMIDYYFVEVSKDDNTVFSRKCIYKRYSGMLRKRLFNDLTYLVVDCYNYSSVQMKDIGRFTNEKEMTLVVYDNYLIPDIDYEYVFIGQVTDMKSIQVLNEKYLSKFNMTTKEVKDLIGSCLEDNDLLVINCKLGKLLYYHYED